MPYGSYQPNTRSKMSVSLPAVMRKWKSSSHVKNACGDVWIKPSPSWRESEKHIDKILQRELFYCMKSIIDIFFYAPVFLGQTEQPSMNWKEIWVTNWRPRGSMTGVTISGTHQMALDIIEGLTDLTLREYSFMRSNVCFFSCFSYLIKPA